jgi:hypothetical protein
MLTYLLIFLKIISPKRLDFVGSVVAGFFDWKVGKNYFQRSKMGDELPKSERYCKSSEACIFIFLDNDNSL